MKKLLLFLLAPFLGIGLSLTAINIFQISGAPPYQVVENPPDSVLGEYAWLENWERPNIPVTVGLQVGHKNLEEIPEELKRLRDNTGASGGGVSEVEVNLAIAEATAEILRDEDIEVDILDATVPPQYFADAFISIHADGNLDPNKSGYKAATPRRDLTGSASKLLELVEKSYEEATDLEKDPNVTHNMKGYYAFGWWRYTHAIHPMTTAIILETGFLSSPHDRTIIVDQPELSAQGLAEGIIRYLESEEVI